MKTTKIFLTISAITVIGLSAVGTKAHAASPGCTVDGAAPGKVNTTLTVSNGKITSNFVVKGENCSINMSLVTWKAQTASGQPLYEQKLYDYKTRTFTPGRHTMTVNLPDCYYQADLIVGTKSDWAEADNTPKRIKLPTNGDPWPDGGLRDFKIGGNKKCTEPQILGTTTTTTSTPSTPATLPNTGMNLASILSLGAVVTVLGAMVHNIVQRKFYSR